MAARDDLTKCVYNKKKEEKREEKSGKKFTNR